MKKILIINTAGLATGGITTHILNYVNEIKNEYDITVIGTILYEKEVINNLREMGCKVIEFPDRKRTCLKYMCGLNKLIRDGKYDVIHVHGNSATMALELEVAKRASVKNRIAHCHNTKSGYPVLNMLLRPWFRRTYNRAVGCSEAAGNWLFGKGNFTVLHNAIELDRFTFSEKYRSNCRKELKVSADCLLLGHVGNFNEQKNHEFIIDVFYELQKSKHAKLLLIGDGEKSSRMQQKCSELGILHKVYFLGRREDVEKWLCAMDVFIFPSKWEGMPLALLEAQVSGLPCVVSDVITQGAIISENVIKLSFEKPSVKWAEAIERVEQEDRKSFYDKHLQEIKQYDIAENVKILEKLYEDISNETINGRRDMKKLKRKKK